jgi:hypothetical protein
MPESGSAGRYAQLVFEVNEISPLYLDDLGALTGRNSLGEFSVSGSIRPSLN